MLLFRYQLTEEEYFDFNYYTFWTAPHRRKYRLLYYLRVLLLYVAVAVLYISLNKNHHPLVDIIVFGSIALVYTLLIPYLVKRSVKKRTEQVLAQPENKHITGPCEVVLTDTGITDKDTGSETRYQWDAIVRRAETITSYFLYTNSHHAIVIPKRVIKSPEETKQLEQMLDRHLSLSAQV